MSSSNEARIPKKILKHPDYKRIVQRLTEGHSLGEILTWLNKKYTKRQTRFRLSKKTLQDFRHDYLNIKGDALAEIRNKRREVRREESIKETKNMIKDLPSYKSAMEEVIKDELDKERRLKQIDKILEHQIMLIGDLFDQAIDREADTIDYKKFSKLNNNLMKNIEQWRNLMHDWAKLIEGQADSVTEHNVNITVVQDELLALKNAVITVLRTMEPDLQAIFLSQLDDEMAKIGDIKEAKYSQIKEG